jgi:hypothetical protein
MRDVSAPHSDATPHQGATVDCIDFTNIYSFHFFLHSENTSRFLNVCFCFYLLSEREKYESPAAFRTVSAL